MRKGTFPLVVAQMVAVLLFAMTAGFAATETSHWKNNVSVGGNLTVAGTTTNTGAVTFTAAPTFSTNTFLRSDGDVITIPDGTNTIDMLGLAQTITGVKTMSAANVITHAPTGLKLQDSDASHVVTIAAGNESANRTVSFPVLGGSDTIATLATTQTFSGAKTFSTPPTITGGLTAANIQTGSAKRQLLNGHFAANVENMVAADTKAYSLIFAPGRAGTVKKIVWACKTAPVGGTDTLTVKKGVGGNTMLSTASVDATTLTDGTATAATLTATGADLQVTATGVIECVYNSGTQTTDAVDLSITIEYEPDDF